MDGWIYGDGKELCGSQLTTHLLHGVQQEDLGQNGRLKSLVIDVAT